MVCAEATAAADAVGPLLSECPQLAQYVKVQLPGTGRLLNLAEVEVYSIQLPLPPHSPSPPCDDCTKPPRNTRPGTDRLSCYMKRKDFTCATTPGIDGYCAGSKHKQDGRYFDADHCQQTCFDRNESLSAGCCPLPPPSSPPPSPCVMCGDKTPYVEIAGGETCGDWRSVRGVELLLDKSCSKEEWITKGYCQQSCFDAGCGYANCCPSPPPSSPLPSPPPARPLSSLLKLSATATLSSTHSALFQAS
eukprot:scaffold7022_cov63-Phaeocystis_antarctica.AAC.1